MRFRGSLAIVIFVALFVLGSCTQRARTDTSTAGAISANTAAAPETRLFERRQLNVSGFNNLNEFIRPDVRERLDYEPGSENSIPEADVADSSQTSEPFDPANEEDSLDKGQELDKVKFLWAKKKFGDALAADPEARGVIFLYADENFYEIVRLTNFVNEGRVRIAERSEIDPSRIEVIFGGYRGVPQVEMWFVPAGQEMPEARPAQREDPADDEK